MIRRALASRFLASGLLLAALASCAPGAEVPDQRLSRLEEELSFLREEVARLEGKIDALQFAESSEPPPAQVLPLEPVPDPRTATCGADAISWEQAAAHVGELRIVAGEIVLASYRPEISGDPTFLNYHDPFEGYFTALIWGDDRPRFVSAFGAPEDAFLDRLICVSGLVEEFQGAPEIILRDPAQVWLP